MKQNRFLLKLKLLVPLMLCTVLSFSSNWGGDLFEIYINNKLVVREFVYKETGMKTIPLDQAKPDDVVNIYYSHCGVLGKSRSLSIKDANGHVLIQFNYPDASGTKKYMTCTVKDITSLQQKNTTTSLYLYYSSKELPGGRLLAGITFTSGNTATANR